MIKTHIPPGRYKYISAMLAAMLFLVSCGKRVAPAPKPQPPPPFEFLNAWGEKGEGPGKLDAPVAFATDSLNRVYFVDPAAGFVHKFESNGTPLLSFEETRVSHASGIAVDAGGAIYVADASRGVILVFFPDGTFLRNMQSAPQPHFSGTLGICVDDDGNVYQPDPARSRVIKFDSHARLVKSWTAPNKTNLGERPSSIATSPDGSVFVAFFDTGRIEKYSSEGVFLTSWVAADTGSGDSHPIASLAMGDGFVFTITTAPVRIHVWTLGGQHSRDGDLGDHVGEIASPQIAVTPHSELLVFDPATPRVYRYRLHLDTKEQP
jgi:streptogramin lyase